VQEEIATIEAVSRAIQTLVRKGRDAEYTFANGIVLKIKAVPPYLLMALEREFPDPEVPVVYLEDKGREEPNPSDPGYLQECADNEVRKSIAVNNLVLAVGTEFVSVPEGMYRPDEDGWLKNLDIVAKITGKSLAINVDDEVQRYVSWLRFYALDNATDITIATGLTYNLSGIQEGEVAGILAAFQGGEGRSADSDGDASGINTNGNQPNRSARRSRARNRGA
jgi:hypothetical protein